MQKIHEVLLMSGRWIYDGCVEKEIHIIKSNFKPGTGDAEDTSEVQKDQFGTFFGVRIGDYEISESFKGGNYVSLEDAKKYAESICPSIRWEANVPDNL